MLTKAGWSARKAYASLNDLPARSAGRARRWTDRRISALDFLTLVFVDELFPPGVDELFPLALAFVRQFFPAALQTQAKLVEACFENLFDTGKQEVLLIADML